MPAPRATPIIHEEIGSWMTFVLFTNDPGYVGLGSFVRQPISDQYAGSLVAGLKYQPGGLSGLHQRGGLCGCAGIGRDAYFASNRCCRRSCARRVLFLKRAFSIQATLITSQKVPLPYLASASAQMPRPAEAAERTIPAMRNWRGVMLRMVLLIRGAHQ